jgi:hypothetical protein
MEAKDPRVKTETAEQGDKARRSLDIEALLAPTGSPNVLTEVGTVVAEGRGAGVDCLTRQS